MNSLRKKLNSSSKKKKNTSETLILYNHGDSKLITIKLIRDYLNMRLDEAKNSIYSISIMGYVRYDLSNVYNVVD